MNSTEALSHKFSRIKISNSVNRNDTPGKRTISANKTIGLEMLESGLIAKNKKLSIMIRNVHHFITSIDEVDWIMN